ncbi:hypothetical protein ACH4MK_33530 [Streptomyces rochei]|uniref:hypothetical protein n=1 Tax=Streptomyces rochei TaxID=1928 RepID=UPI00378A77B6
MQQTLRDQRITSQRETRRAAYVACLTQGVRARDAVVAEWGDHSDEVRARREDALAAFNEAVWVVRIEGSADAVVAADWMSSTMNRTDTQFNHRCVEFLDAAKRDLEIDIPSLDSFSGEVDGR